MLGARKIEEVWEEGRCHRCKGMVRTYDNGERECMTCGMADYSRLKLNKEKLMAGGDTVSSSGRTPWNRVKIKDWSLVIRHGKALKPILCLWPCEVKDCRDTDYQHGCHVKAASGSVYCNIHTTDFQRAFRRRPFLWREMAIGSEIATLSIVYQVRKEGRRVTWAGKYADITSIDCSGWFPINRESISGIKARFEADTGARLVKLDIALGALERLRVGHA